MSGVEAEMLAMEREGNFRVQEWCSNCGHQLMKMRNKDLFCCNCDMTVMMCVNGHKENNNDIGYGKSMFCYSCCVGPGRASLSS